MKDWQIAMLALGAGLIGVAIIAEIDPKTRSKIVKKFLSLVLEKETEK